MMQTSQLLEQLIHSLRCLPGVGPKSAQRMAFYLLQRNRQGGIELSTALMEAMTKIGIVKIAAPSRKRKSARFVRILDDKKKDKFV